MNSMKGKRYWIKKYGIFVVDGIILAVFIILQMETIHQQRNTMSKQYEKISEQRMIIQSQEETINDMKDEILTHKVLSSLEKRDLERKIVMLLEPKLTLDSQEYDWYESKREAWEKRIYLKEEKDVAFCLNWSEGAEIEEVSITAEEKIETISQEDEKTRKIEFSHLITDKNIHLLTIRYNCDGMIAYRYLAVTVIPTI